MLFIVNGMWPVVPTIRKNLPLADALTYEGGGACAGSTSTKPIPGRRCRGPPAGTQGLWTVQPGHHRCCPGSARGWHPAHCPAASQPPELGKVWPSPLPHSGRSEHVAHSKASKNKSSLNITQPTVFIPTGNVQIPITSQSIEIKMEAFTFCPELDSTSQHFRGLCAPS